MIGYILLGRAYVTFGHISLSLNLFLRQFCAFYTLPSNCFAVFVLVSFAVFVLVSLHFLYVRCISSYISFHFFIISLVSLLIVVLISI